MIVYGALATVPYLDLDILGVIAGLPVIGHLIAWIPYIKPIHLSDLGDSTDFIILLVLVIVPYVDLEVFKLLEKFGIQGFESFDLTSEVRERAQGSYVNENGEIVTTDGGVQRRGNGGGSSSSGSMIKKLLMIGGPIVIVMFLLGSGYGDLVANQVGFQVAGIDVPNIGATVAQGVKTLECVGNVACVRQWQFNNTQRPGSEEVGQEYNLKIENFDVNDGFPLDVANRQSDDRVPIDFSVYNPRHGLKGIEAQNVAYRVGVYDSKGSLLDNPGCQTGWLPLGGEYADNNFGQNGTILPGGFATPLGTHSELTLRECGILQPALGVNRRVKLQLAYDYSSQSTLQVQAMSRDNMLSLEQRPSFKKSQTADTPVKTYVNVESPITYRNDEATGEAESSIFGLRVGFETGQRDIKYRVHTEGFKLYDSGETIDVDSAGGFDSDAISCEDLNHQQNNRYTFSTEMTDYLDNRQEGAWFESNSGPSPARCSMVLENPGSISPTGETLTFRIDANYTVLLEEVATGFKVQNSQCTRYECPMLVPQSHEEVSTGNLISQCESSIRLDANKGCSARYGEDWPDTVQDYALKDDVDSKIEEGETAVIWENVLSAVSKEMPSGRSQFTYTTDGIDSDTVIGVELSSLTDVDTGVVGLTRSLGDIDTKEVYYQICSSEGNLQTRYPEQAGYGDNLVFASIYLAPCESILEEYLDSAGCQRSLTEFAADIASLDTANWEDVSNSCKSALREYRECSDGITAYRPDSHQLACISSGN